MLPAGLNWLNTAQATDRAAEERRLRKERAWRERYRASQQIKSDLGELARFKDESRQLMTQLRIEDTQRAHESLAESKRRLREKKEQLVAQNRALLDAELAQYQSEMRAALEQEGELVATRRHELEERQRERDEERFQTWMDRRRQCQERLREDISNARAILEIRTQLEHKNQIVKDLEDRLRTKQRKEANAERNTRVAQQRAAVEAEVRARDSAKLDRLRQTTLRAGEARGHHNQKVRERAGKVLNELDLRRQVVHLGVETDQDARRRAMEARELRERRFGVKRQNVRGPSARLSVPVLRFDTPEFTQPRPPAGPATTSRLRVSYPLSHSESATTLGSASVQASLYTSALTSR